VFSNNGTVLVSPSFKFRSSTNLNGVLGTGRRNLGSLGTETAALILVEQLQEQEEEKRKLEACKEAIILYMVFSLFFLRKCKGFL
jgi:hypothetical protein